MYAAGDATNFPIKQGGLGAQQADAAAEHIAALVGAEVVPQPFHPVLRGKLLTGDESISLRHDVTGGTGEGEASADYLWWPPHKVAGRYLAAFLSSGPAPARASGAGLAGGRGLSAPGLARAADGAGPLSAPEAW